MILYHGTNEQNLKNILKEGFLPRTKTKTKSNWAYGKGKGNKNLVYFSTAYAAYYARASSKGKENRPVVIKLDIPDYIIENQFFPDEEFLRHKIFSETGKWVMMEKIDSTLEKYNDDLYDSIEYLGTCAALNLDKKYIVGWCVLTPRQCIMMCDPSISPLNYKFCGEMYKKSLEELKFTL